jgi:hypothetical protein
VTLGIIFSGAGGAHRNKAKGKTIPLKAWTGP